MGRNGHVLRVHHGYVGLVRNVHVDCAFAVARRLLRLSSQIKCPNHGTFLRVDHRGVRRHVAQHPHALIVRIKHDSVGTAVHVNRLDHLQSACVPHRDRFCGGEPMVRFGIDHSAAGPHTGNRADRFKRIQVEDRQLAHRTTAWDIQTTAFDVGGNVIKTAFAANFGYL